MRCDKAEVFVLKALEERILKEGKLLPGNIVKVDGFINHRVDVAFLRELAREFKAHFGDKKPNLIMTVEASGIPLATVCAEEFGVPMLFAKKAKSDNIEVVMIPKDCRYHGSPDQACNTCK